MNLNILEVWCKFFGGRSLGAVSAHLYYMKVVSDCIIFLKLADQIGFKESKCFLRGPKRLL